MIVKIVILGFMIILSEASYAQKAFLDACRDPSSASDTFHNDIKWFQHLYKTKDCQEIASKLNRLKSLSDIVQPWNPLPAELNSSWVKSFDYIYGNKELAEAFLSWTISQNVKHNIFKNVEFYRDFSNVTSLRYSRDYQLPYSLTLCETLELFPNLKTVSIDGMHFDKAADQCLLDKKVSVIITRSSDTFNEFNVQSNVIGIEQYMGNLDELLQLNNLKYLGLTDERILYGEDESEIRVDGVLVNGKPPIPPVELATLGSLPNLTHLTLASSNIVRIHELKYSYNLTWLSLSCAPGDSKLERTPCAKNAPYLKNLSFLSSLKWLEYLDLSYNWLETIPTFKELTKLKTLKLRGNSLSNLPWEKGSSKISYLDVSGNKINNLESLKNLEELTLLNVSGNKIKDFSPLNELKKIKFLNLSNNLYQDSLQNFNPSPSLKALSLNGGCNTNDTFDDLTLDHFIDYTNPEVNLYLNAIFGDFEVQKEDAYVQNNPEANQPVDPEFWKHAKKNLCQDKEFISSEIDFSKFKNLEALSIRYNKFSFTPNLRQLPFLKYLNLEGNQIQRLDAANLPASLQVLQLPWNKISKFPELKILKKLMKVSLTANNIKSLAKLNLPNNNMTLNLTGNKISNIRVLDTPKFINTVTTLYGNPINPKKCPRQSKNHDLSYFCEGANNGYSTGELDSLGLH